MDSFESKTGELYKEFVRFRRQTNPCIEGLLHFLEAPRSTSSYNSCRLYVAGCSVSEFQSSPLNFEKIDLVDLPTVLTPPASGHKRLIIIEDLHPSIVELLGASLDIDPTFFAEYIVTNYGDIEKVPSPPSVALAPSQLLQNGWLHLHSQKAVDLGSADMFRGCAWKLVTSGNVPRTMRRLVPLSGRQLGIVRGCSSFFVKNFDQSWIGESGAYIF